MVDLDERRLVHVLEEGMGDEFGKALRMVDGATRVVWFQTEDVRVRSVLD